MRCSKAPCPLSSHLLLLLFLLFLNRPSLAQKRGAAAPTGAPPVDLQIAPSNQTASPSVKGVTNEAAAAAPPPETGLSTPSSGDVDDEDEAPAGGTRCQGYYDVMGQWDPPFNCNAGMFLYCCGTCFYRFCCQFRLQRLDQTICSNYDTPIWANTGKPVSTVTEGHADHDRDRTHMIVYIICGVVAIMVLVGIFTKLALEKTRGGGAGQNDLSNTRALTELLKQPGGEGGSMDNTLSCPPMGGGANGVSARMLRSRSEQYHLSNAGFSVITPGLPHPHSNLSSLALNKYTSLKAVADTASRGYYKSYPLMDFSHYQPAAPPVFQPTSLYPKEKSYLHQTHQAHPSLQGHPSLVAHNLHAPLSISIPPSHLEHSRLPKTTTHPLLSSSAFKAWESSGHHVQRKTSHPGPSSSGRRYGSYSSGRRQYSIETLPDIYSQPQPYGGHLGPLAPQPHPSHYHHARHKSYSTNSKTEVTV